MTETDKMLAHTEDGVGILTFNNPERHNAVSLDMWEAAGTLLEGFAADPAVRVVVLTGAGGKAFVSGADISRFEDERADVAAYERYNAAVERTTALLAAFPKPTVAMIRGYCLGGGVAIAVCCDLRICSDNSRFAVPAARLGIGYAYGGLTRIVDLVGPAFAKEILFTARQFTAAEAHQMGLVNQVVAHDELDAYVRDYAGQIAENAPLTVAAAKVAVGEAVKDPGERDLARCDAMVRACFDSRDYVEGRRAFMEKRKPEFEGR
ncbi:Short-chain-enoyl-CoA hydratase [Rhodoplanes serenus]|uniref:Short-chain-enoyl-CoA hydratase n=1 Tax=Rhodoplanes serenus TaxID=200615 RepID=A0A3S5CYD4_9BRAD|nr:enoyl-CoA hydratase [Rhodoplanes serenus]VCU09050.1 Short-chain-enoyl-CoA hydratase [Rhodoplanes serenus]